MKVALSTHDAAVHAFDRASTIAFCAYSLVKGSSIERALERAADRGARVSVALEGAPYANGGGGAVGAANLGVAAELRRHGVCVRLAGPADERLHLKAAVVDNATAFFDDRNWPERGDTIVASTERAQIDALSGALSGRPRSDARLATEKGPALGLEAKTIAGSRSRWLDVETESFGACSVSAALCARAKGGVGVRLVLSARAYARASPREKSTVAHMAAAGVSVRLGGSDQKLCVGQDRGWVGSANATFAPGAMLDWGLQTRDRSICEGLERTFAGDWRAARPLPAT